MLVAENLTPEGANQFVGGLMSLTSHCLFPEDAVAAIERIAELIDADPSAMANE